MAGPSSSLRLSVPRKTSARPSALISLKVAEMNTDPERSLRSDADALQRQRPSNLIVDYTKIC